MNASPLTITLTLTLTSKIETRHVANHARRDVLVRHFGLFSTRVEQRVDRFLKRASPEFGGAFWRFWELTNGGFLMTPLLFDTPWLCLKGEGIDAELSPDDAGIVACLRTFRALSWPLPGNVFDLHFRRLHAFARQRHEADRILAALG